MKFGLLASALIWAPVWDESYLPHRGSQCVSYREIVSCPDQPRSELSNSIVSDIRRNAKDLNTSVGFDCLFRHNDYGARVIRVIRLCELNWLSLASSGSS